MGIYKQHSKTNKKGGLGFNVGWDLITSFLTGVAHSFVNGVKTFAKLIWGAGTWTPHPANPGNWFQNPQNGVWQHQWHIYKTITRPIAFLLTLIATGMYFGLGSKSLHVMDPATEQQGKRHILVAWIMVFAAWPLGGLYLGVVNLISQVMISGMSSPDIGAGIVGAGLALVVLILVLVMQFWTVILMLIAFGLRLVGLVAFMPFLPLFFALRAVPLAAVSNSSDAIIHLWVYLVLLPLPVAALLSIGFAPGLTKMVSNLAVGGALLLVAIKIGALIGAVIVPFAMYQKMKEHGLTTGVAGAEAPGQKLRDSYERQRETAARRKQQAQKSSRGVRNFGRGAKNQPQINPDGTSGVRNENGTMTGLGDTRSHRTGKWAGDRARSLRDRL